MRRFSKTCSPQKWSTPRDAQIIEVGGERVGLLVVEERPDCYWLDEIQIDAEHRGHGIGRDIIRTVLNTARSAGQPLRLQVLQKNYRAKRLYEEIGFVDVAQLEHHFLMEMV